MSQRTVDRTPEVEERDWNRDRTGGLVAPSTTNVALANESDCEATALGSSITRKALTTPSVPR